MEPLDIGVEIWTMRRDDMGFHSKTPEEAHQRGGEIAATWAADKAGIVIKGEPSRQAMRAQKLGDHLQQGFGIEIRSDLSMRPDRGACIHEVGDLNHVLLLPQRISGDAAGIFEIELDFLP